ncbi:hypothetical protein ENHAE0001_1162 [Enhydrobacter aerosaccus SK60]|nr:hypothetical protein ENHAE0001_1162 [Enhydrobacter aerosaccus SK60]
MANCWQNLAVNVNGLNLHNCGDFDSNFLPLKVKFHFQKLHAQTC